MSDTGNTLLGTTKRPGDTRFARMMSNLEAALRRYDPRGRNAEASKATQEWRFRLLQDMARTDEVCDLLDNNPTLASRWNKLERKMAGLS